MIAESKTERVGIPLDADPIRVPEGFEVIEHIHAGRLPWNPRTPQIDLFLPPMQRKKLMHGNEVAAAIAAYDGLPVNANALDYFLENAASKPWLLPEEWKFVDGHSTRHILFWGTRYRYEGGICVRSLDWNADARARSWSGGFCWVDNDLNQQFPAAMLPGRWRQGEQPEE